MPKQYHHFKEPQLVQACDANGESGSVMALGYWADSDSNVPTFCLARGGAKDSLSGEWLEVEVEVPRSK